MNKSKLWIRKLGATVSELKKLELNRGNGSNGPRLHKECRKLVSNLNTQTVS